jgi:thiol:disulfide interchange protein DsbC
MKRVLIALSLALPLFASAQTQAPKKSVVLHPSIPPVESVKDAPFPNWLELGAGGKTFYLSSDGRYMMLGKVVDLGVQPGGVTPQVGKGAPAPAPTIDVSKLPLKQAIKFVNGNGKRSLYVFSDPDCPYCRKFEQEMGQLTNTTVYVFPYPLENLHPGAKNHASLIWCEPNRANAWRDTMVNGQLMDTSKPGACANPIDANIALGRSLGITGTPTIFTPDGRRIIGYVPVPAIVEYLDRK